MNQQVPMSREAYEKMYNPLTNTRLGFVWPYEQYLAWVKNSNAARRAVLTKRQKYTTWPTRKRDHKLK